MEEKVKITFCGGAEGTTGSNFLICDDKENTKVLVDCGLFQGGKVSEDKNREQFIYDPKTIDYLFVTHAHIDHIGRIPFLVKNGFKGKIISTPPTKDISELMLIDSMGVLGKEAKEDNLPPLYEEKDVRASMELWETTSYHKEIVAGDFKVKLKDAGHILGSSMVEIVYRGKKFLFTGDLGNSPAPLLKDTEYLDRVDILVMESVYGDRNHEGKDERKNLLEDVIEETINKGGILMIPAFSLERTQILLYEINDLVENGKIPDVPIFIDSPLAIDVTKVYKKYNNYFNEETKYIIREGDDIFKFKNLHFTYTRDESIKISNTPSPKVIIAGAGMSNGGRIIHHEKHHLSDPNNTLLLISYQVPGSLGRILQDGAKSVKIMGAEIPVRAQIKNIPGYSAHKDSDNLLEWVANGGDFLKKIFVVLGEPKSELFLVQKIRDYLGLNAVTVKNGETMEINV